MKKVTAFIPKFGKLKNFWRVLLIFFLSFFISQFSFASEVERFLNDRYPHLEKFYQERHQHPELSKQESETSQKLAEELRALGFQVTEKVGGFGVVAVLKNGEGPVGLIRTDMDALPIQEATVLPYKSLVPSIMHACGHDVHMSVFLGTAYLLTQLKGEWRGTLVMIGQPAEEVGAGSRAMIEAGLFKKFPKPDYALALHVMDFLPAGIVGFTKGYALANVDSVDITVYGKGGHGAKPHTTIDPIVLSSQIVLALQTLVSREIDPIQSAVVTVGSIHGGTKHNIIPNEVHLQLTVRSYEESVRQHLKEGTKRIAENLAAMAKAPKPKVEFSEGTPALYNDPRLVDTMGAVFEEVFGKEKVKELPKGMWGEDFSRYGLEGNIPIVMFGLGAQPKDKTKWGTAHSPTFAPDFEPTLKTGVVAMTKAFLKLQSKFPLP